METLKQKHERQLQELRDYYLGPDTSTETRAQEDQAIAAERAAEDAKTADKRAAEDELWRLADEEFRLEPKWGQPAVARGEERAAKLRQDQENRMLSRINEDNKLSRDRDREDERLARRRRLQDKQTPNALAEYEADVADLNDKFAAKEAARKQYQKQYQKQYRQVYKARQRGTRQTPESDIEAQSPPWDWKW